MSILTTLKEIEALKEVPDDQLNWLIDNGEILDLEKGDYLFKPGDPIDQLLIMLEGQAVIKIQQGNQFRMVNTLEALSITGYLPYSRADKAFGYAQISKPTKLLTLEKASFREMITQQEDLTTALVHLMSTRIREFTKSQQLDDKMMSLGKLSAGLAHELNNPSAAIVRSAQALSSHLKAVPESFKRIIKTKMTEDQVDLVNKVLFAKMEAGTQSLSMMDRSEKEDDLIDWLDDEAIEDSDDIAENLVEFGIEASDLDEIKDAVGTLELPAVIGWINQMLTTERLVGEIEEASQRINKLVTSIKGYTHMDQAPEKIPTDVHKGLESTLTMLNHKINNTGIKVKREFQSDLEEPSILVSEMNQVWTNLIDNAIDAMETSEVQELTLRTFAEGDHVYVVIGDSGTGIPEEIQDKVFDPFFTTKEVGKGTGLGMEVVHRIVTNQHSGSISFTSEPGKTEFKVCLPINSN